MVTRLCVVLACLPVAFLGGCSGGSQNPKCIPGASAECYCPTGQSGAQTCTSAGTFAACVCLAPTVDGGGLDGAGDTTTPATSTDGAGGQTSLPADASTGAADAGGQDGVTDSGLPADVGKQVDVTDSGLPADAGGQDGVADSGLPADADAGDAVYVATRCGDGIVVLPERCDDGNTVAGDGCSSTCQWEPGWACTGTAPNYTCHKTTCGDGKAEGTESCDDGNDDLGDGCTPLCTLEPDCSGGACKSTCGDGIVLSNLGEECDDGNAISGDGCSSTCKVEPGYECKQPPLGDTMLVPVVYRDFRFHNPVDFEAGVSGSYNPLPGMVNATLDANGKPVYSGIGGNAHVSSADTFNQWYRDVAGVNHATPTTMTLWNNGQGAYVNRYGANGERWNVTETAYFCGYVGQESLDASGNPIPCTIEIPDADVVATDCTRMAAKGEEMLKCYVDGKTYSATFLVSKADGNPLFFPVDGDTFTPASELTAAQIPPYYDPMGTWPFDLDAAGNKRLHNFSFTSEVRYWFLYDKTKTYTLGFVGDDDVWVFINRKLSVDLGGIHTPVDGSIVIGADGNGTTTITPTYPISPPAAATQQSINLGLQSGQLYEIAVFQAERQTTTSSFKITLSGFNMAPSECTPCGDGITAGDGGCSNATGGAGAGGGTGAGGTGAGGTGGIGGASGTGGTNPFATGGSGKGGVGGGAGGTTIVSSGGTGAAGGAGGTTSSTSSVPPPTSGLQVWVAQKTTGGGGTLGGYVDLNLRIDNKTAQTVDMSTVTLRYWYQDEGLGTTLVLATNYVTIGYSNLGKVTSGIAVAKPSPVAGADHYLELSFSGTLAATGDKATNDQFNIQVTLHTASYTGAVDVTNDYSYDAGAAGVYEQKITLYESGKLIWGVEP